MHFLADYLADQSYKVFVLGAKIGTPNYFGMNPVYETIHLPFKRRVVSISPDNKNVDYVNLKKQTRYEPIKKRVKAILKSIFNLFWNDPVPAASLKSLIWVREVEKNVIDLISEKKIDVVIVSGPPFSTFVIAKKIKQMYKDRIKIIFDYRDPWNTLYNGKFFSTLTEKKILRFPDKIVVASERLKRNLVETLGIKENRIESVYNGFSEGYYSESSQIDKSFTKNDKLILTSIGSCGISGYDSKNEYPFFKAYKRFYEGKRVFARFAGIQRTEYTDEIKRQLGDSIDFFPMIPRELALGMMLISDVNVVIYTDTRRAKYMITGKFFDYLRAGKVIVGIGPSDTEFKKWIEKHELGFACNNTPEEIYNLLVKLYSLWESGRLQNARKETGINIEEYSRESQNSKYEIIIEGLFEKK